MKIENAKTLPQVYFGLHMVEGVAEYQEPGKEPYRIFIGEQTIKNMDPTFKGRPVYVQHVDEVDLDNLQAEADGYVIRSFFNKADGKHWAEFIVVSDQGHEAIRKGWKLSNAYIPKALSAGGLWHGVEYTQEVTTGEYEHLAIVPNPRYEESVILTPDEFKAYNSKKEAELMKLANSKETKPMFKFWKKTAIENAADLENMMVTLPVSKKEMTISEIIKNADAGAYAHPEHKVKVGNDEFTVGQLVNKYMALHKANKAEPAPGSEDAAPEPELHNEEKKGDADEAPEPEMHNDDDALMHDDAMKHDAEYKKLHDAYQHAKKMHDAYLAKKKNKDAGHEAMETPAEEKAEHNDELPKEEHLKAFKKAEELAEHEVEHLASNKKKANSKEHFEALKNAPLEAFKNEAKFELSEDKVARGRARYGSK